MSSTVQKNLGLSKKEVSNLQKKFGLNQLPDSEKNKWWKKFLAQFANPLVYILLATSVITALMREWADSLILLIVVCVNSIVGYIQETKADNTAEALKAMIKTEAKVWRDGVLEKITTNEIVPGDIVELEAGDVVPADGKILIQNNLAVTEAGLTGEPYPINKKVDDEVYQSSPVHRGTARIIITTTGAHTKLGQISQSVSKQKKNVTPLEKKISDLSGKIVWLAAISFLLMLAFSWRGGYTLMETFSISVSLAVSSIPEGLPIVLTLTLALGASKMSKAKTIVKNLPSTSSLAGVDIIATDKTGTITQGNLILRDIATLDEITTDCKEGTPILHDREHTVQNWIKTKTDKHIIKLASLCNDATYIPGKSAIGDLLDLAILKAAHANKIPFLSLRKTHPVVKKIPFDSSLKLAAAIVQSKNTPYKLIVKGAPEEILSRCKFTHSKSQTDINTYVELLSANGLRTIIVATKDLTKIPPTSHQDNLEIPLSTIKDLEFAGVLVFIDPLRKEVPRSVAQIKDAGVRVIMITGDHLSTAKYIAKQAGIYHSEDGDLAFLGEDIEKMLSDRKFAKQLNRVAVIARATPNTKMLVLEKLKKQGRVVAMTGDGVNDAPALAAADIGIAMGKSGTQVATEAADMILTDDNFATLVVGIKEARRVFDNLRKVITFLISTTILEILFLLTTVFLKWPLPLTAIQILWLNLVTDGFLDFAIGVEPAEDNLLARKPRHYQNNLLQKENYVQIIFLAVVMTIMMMGTYIFWRGQIDASSVLMNTLMLLTITVLQWFNAFNCRSPRASLFHIGWFKNKTLFVSLAVVITLQLLAVYLPLFHTFLGTTYLPWMPWLLAIISGFLLIAIEEIRKLLIRLIKSKT